MIPPHTERLEFRRFTPEDAELLVELDSDPEVMRFLTEGRPTPREMVVNEVMPRVIGMYDRLPGRGVFASFVEGRFAGWFHLKPGHYWPEELELGYRLRREYWGKGLGDGGVARADPLLLRRTERIVRHRDDAASEHGVAPRDGEGGDAVRARVC